MIKVCKIIPVTKEREVLLVRRSESDTNPDMWGFLEDDMSRMNH